MAETTSYVTTRDWDAGASERRSHEGVTFLDLDLCETDLEGVEFSGCTFRDARLNCSRQIDVAFLNCTFVNCTFFDATFTNCKMVGSGFERCTFDIMTVEGGDWSFTSLPRADLSSATLTGVRMREADLTGARCHGGTMRDLDLSGATLTAVDFTGCDLRGTDLSALDPATAELRNAIITVDQAVSVAMALGLQIRD
ncbi:pentapeptide repeat-containing protein [Actinoplanes aureus]|uniref:Pentapeptide repeat-containing protein n=1 Tax=Actinoplanes aureus TaxID=2792083 RepID=A0A931CIK0_9ACTN|nr:pentapeptide repeat-containing protein [Actinoplanes aureus]MBG0567983.1 pentapeptide repeat-containing protein [Actinoplanes aureus]